MINKKEDHDRKYIAKCTQRKEMIGQIRKKKKTNIDTLTKEISIWTNISYTKMCKTSGINE